AAGTLNAMLHPGSGGTTHFNGTTLTAHGNTINVQSSINPTTFDLGTATVSLTAGSGGIQAPDILFANGSSLLLQTTNGGDINIYGTRNGASDTIVASGAFSSQSDVSALTLQAGTSINIGGSVVAADFIRAGTTINVAGELSSPSGSAGGDVTAANIQATIDNSNGGTIGADATINVTAANITANSLVAQIDNTGGSIGGNAAINMNVSGNTSIATGATVRILGNNPSGTAAINFNGGSYAIGSPGTGGMFLS